jgi:hypothetical protein
MAKRRLFAVFAFALTMLVAAQAFGQLFTEGVRPSGMGMAYTGVASGASSIFHNPGGIASRMMYQVEGTYEYNPSGSVLNASVVDSKTNPDIAAGVAYSYFFGRGDLDTISGHDVHLGLALPVIPERISVGVGGRYLNVSVSPEDDDQDDFKLISGITLDAGVLFQVADRLRFGVAGQNLIDLCDEDMGCSNIAPTQIAGGASFGDESTFLLAVDGGLDLTSDPEGVQPFVGVGAEYFAANVAPIRVGYQRLQATERNVLTAGFGVRLDTAGLDFGFRIDPAESEHFFANGSFSVYF